MVSLFYSQIYDLFSYFVWLFQFIILASALCCTAFAYPVFEDYQYAGHDLNSHEGDNFDNGSYQPVAASRIGVHELGGHEDEHVDYYVCNQTQNYETFIPFGFIQKLTATTRLAEKKMICGKLMEGEVANCNKCNKFVEAIHRLILMRKRLAFPHTHSLTHKKSEHMII